VVAGRWYGVTGRRFVRPSLQVHGQRRLIALLDHKPWSPEEGVQWLAAFPDDGYVGPSQLQVAPDIAVELPPAGPEAGDGKPRPARLVRPPVRRGSLEAEPGLAETPPAAVPMQAGRERPDARTAEIEAARDTALAEVEAIRQKKDEARADADRLRAELDAVRRESERAHSELDHTHTDADRLRTELSHARAEVNTLRPGHDEARAKAERLEAEVARLRAEADRAVAERNAARTELERVRRAPARHAYIAPRPVAFRESEPRPGLRIRAVSAFLVAAAFAVLLQLLFHVL
jgi:hypothetical protein